MEDAFSDPMTMFLNKETRPTANANSELLLGLLNSPRGSADMSRSIAEFHLDINQLPTLDLPINTVTMIAHEQSEDLGHILAINSEFIAYSHKGFSILWFDY